MPSSERDDLLTPITFIQPFFKSAGELAEFEPVADSDTPTAYRKLLAHDEHMTVALEEFYKSIVDVKVLRWRMTGSHYTRNSLLTRRVDGAVVQFCVVRLNFDYLDEQVRGEIRSGRTPLGRVLIQHDVMRKVELLSLWKVQCQPKLMQIFGLDSAATTYGRMAVIHCGGDLAIELLEVVSPVDMQ